MVNLVPNPRVFGHTAFPSRNVQPGEGEREINNDVTVFSENAQIMT